MARVTIEDCVKKVFNRFELVVLAAHRAKEIANGTPAVLPRDGNKDAVLALREIASGIVSLELLRESIVKKHQSRQYVQEDQPEDDKSDTFKEDMSNYSVSNKDIKKISNTFEDTDEDDKLE